MYSKDSIDKRLVSLAREKSRYQFLSDILSDLIGVQGLDTLISHIINTTMDAWGGMNVILYYSLDSQYVKHDAYGESRIMDELDDPLVRKIWDSGVFSEISQQDDRDYNRDLPGFDGDRKIWLYPLMADDQVFGVLKIEGVILSFIDDVKDMLGIIISYYAIVLHSELLTAGSLMKANKALRKEIAEKAEEQKKYKQTIENSFDGFWINDMAGNFLEINDTYCTMTGYTRDEMLTMNILDVEAKETAVDVERNMAYLKEKGKGRFESQHRCRDGSLFDVEINTSYSNWGDGIFYVFLRDISEKNRQARENKALQEKYFQVQRVESIGRLAGGVAHDLNNLFTPILGYCEILSQNLDNREEAKEQVSEIYEAGLRARDLVNQLLVFSRKQNLEFRREDLNGIIENFQTLLRRTIREDIDFIVKLKPGIGAIKVDVRNVEQVIMNLCVNAQDAMKAGGTLTVETDQLLIDREDVLSSFNMEPGMYICLKISDTGIGMDEDIINRVFEPFYTTKGEMGTGLGLATVYGIVIQHKGGIRIESKPGNGTTFHVYFPICLEKEQEKDIREKKDQKDVRQVTILLVEDNFHVRKLAYEFLKMQGHEILTAENGKEGWEIIQDNRHQIDLLITDIIMPEMGGRELYQKTRELRPDIKVIFMSGYNDESLTDWDLPEGEVYYLQKPFSLTSIKAGIKEALGT